MLASSTPPTPPYFSQPDGLWVFAYGSLMWRPEFEVDVAYKAQLNDYHRDFCISSIFYRGTKDHPGLVLGLDHGGTCEGVVYKIKTGLEEESLAAIRKREQPTKVYRERIEPVTLLTPLDGSAPYCDQSVKAVCYVADTAHAQYRPDLSNKEKAQIIIAAHGSAGPNQDYLANTLSHLVELGIDDPILKDIMQFTKTTPS